MPAISDYPCLGAHSKNSFIFIRSKFVGKILAIVLVESKRTINNSPS